MYGYYPGCSLSGTAKEYDVSTRAIFKELGAELAEIPDWTCCGASAVESVDRDLAMLLPARNLALAEQRLDVDDILIPCSGCYLNLLNADQKARSDKEAMRAINQGLALEGLSYAGRIRPRHILDILLNDLGPDRIADRVARGFDDLLIE